MKRLAPLLVLAALATEPSCFGSYGAVRTLHRWNGTATRNRIANSAIHVALWILPIYELAITADFVIFNNIEFLTGNSVFK